MSVGDQYTPYSYPYYNHNNLLIHNNIYSYNYTVAAQQYTTITIIIMFFFLYSITYINSIIVPVRLKNNTIIFKMRV